MYNIGYDIAKRQLQIQVRPGGGNDVVGGARNTAPENLWNELVLLLMV